MREFEGAQLPPSLSSTESEFSWYIFELVGRGRRLAGLVTIHRTGPRANSVEWGPQLLAGRDLPSPLRDLVPAWLPIVSPVRIATDDRPLLTVALYDLDARSQPLVIEQEVSHDAFDARRFTASSRDASVKLDGETTTIAATGEAWNLEVCLSPVKPMVMFGDGSPSLRHGKITTNYVQRPRLTATGTVTLLGRTHRALKGEGVHDHQWLRVTVPNLKWIWPHLRLPDGRELTGYVIRDASAGARADADEGRELGRAGWLVERDGTVRKLPTFDVRAIEHVTTERGRVPTRFSVTVPELKLELVLDHVVAAPFLRMRAFGDAIDGGIYEGPVDVRANSNIRGWVEVMNAAHVRLG